jgi:2-phospho-L-lactate guanylyltransferase (CobY/MobA/RfbA family)
MTMVRVTGARRRYGPISFVKAVRKATGEGLAAAKQRLDLVMEGQPIEIDIADDLVAAFISEVEQIGFIVQLDPLPPAVGT